MTGLDAHNALYRLAYRLQEARKLAASIGRIELVFDAEDAQALADALAIATTAPRMLVGESTVSAEEIKGEPEAEQEASGMAGDGVDDLRFDVEWHCPECGHEAREENVPAPGVSWAHCPVCWGRMYARLTQHNLAIQSQEGGGDGERATRKR